MLAAAASANIRLGPRRRADRRPRQLADHRGSALLQPVARAISGETARQLAPRRLLPTHRLGRAVPCRACYLFTETRHAPGIGVAGRRCDRPSTCVGDLLYALDRRRPRRRRRRPHRDCPVRRRLLPAGRSVPPPEHRLARRAPQAPANQQRMLGRLIITTSSLIFPVIVLAATGPATTPPTRSCVRISALVLAGAVTLRVVHSVRANSDAGTSCCAARRPTPLTGLPNRTLLLERIIDVRPRVVAARSAPDAVLRRPRPVQEHQRQPRPRRRRRGAAHRRRPAHQARCPRGRWSPACRATSTSCSIPPPARSGRRWRSPSDCSSVFREPLALSQGDVFVTASIGVSSIELDAPARRRRTCCVTPTRRCTGPRTPAATAWPCYDESMHERVAHRLVGRDRALPRARPARAAPVPPADPRSRQSGDVVGFEALMRWQQGDGTIVSPAEFIPIAEDTGTIVPIGVVGAARGAHPAAPLDRRRRVQPVGHDVGQRVAAPAQPTPTSRRSSARRSPGRACRRSCCGSRSPRAS